MIDRGGFGFCVAALCFSGLAGAALASPDGSRVGLSGQPLPAVSISATPGPAARLLPAAPSVRTAVGGDSGCGRKVRSVYAGYGEAGRVDCPTGIVAVAEPSPVR